MVGIFDSGLGGLTAVRAFRAAAPRASFVYFGDTGRVPYGTRSQETILRYAMQDLRFLSRFSPKAVLVACGTVSANALYVLQNLVPFPVFGVVEAAARAAIAHTKNKRIAVLGTDATIRTHAYRRALEARSDVQVLEVACPLFVPLVEHNLTDPQDMVVREICRRYLQPVRAWEADILVLGCTHYPLLAEAISAELPKVALVDPGKEASQDLLAYAVAEAAPRVSYYVSDDVRGFEPAATRFLGGHLGGKVSHVEIEKY